MRNPGLSGENCTLDDIAYYHTDTEKALRAYFAEAAISDDPRLADYTPSEALRIRLSEHDRCTMLTLLAALEAAFKVDYHERVSKKRKDKLSREFRDLFKQKGPRVSLEEDLLNAWRDFGAINPKLIGELKGAFKYRHWLAHGRYWVPKLPRNFDYLGVYTLADEVFGSFPFAE